MSKLQELITRADKKFPKIMVFSLAKVGKTHAICGFPCPYILDTEHGADYPQYRDMVERGGGHIGFTTDMGEMLEVQKELMSTKHPYKTYAVDSFSVAYAEELFKNSLIVGTEWSRHKIPSDRLAKHLVTLALRMPMTVIFTNHLKDKWVKGEVVGTIHDSYNKLDHYFDLLLEIVKRGPDRIAIVRGSRVPQLPEGTEFPWCYDELANRMGREVFEGEVVPVELATPEQIARVKELLETRTDAPTLTEKWFKKAEAEDWSEMTKDILDKCINFLMSGAKESK
jgi:hypothetical protein